MSRPILSPTNGFAAQDYRTSRARGLKRIDAGETALTCPDCGTETDVAAAAHSPACKDQTSEAPPVAETNGKTTKGWEVGRDGKRRGSHERSPDGSFTAGEMQRRQDARLDAAPTVTRCAFCDWTFDGTAEEGRVAAAEHRTETHPDRGPVKRRGRFATPRQSSSSDFDGLAALEAMVRGDPQPRIEPANSHTAEVTPPGPSPVTSSFAPTNEVPKPEEEAPMVQPSTPAPWSRKPVSDDQAVIALQEAARELGHVPTQWEWRKAKRRPSDGVYERKFGNWAGACSAAGLEPPATQRETPVRPAKGSGRERPTPPAPEEGPSPAPSPAVSPAVRQEPLEPGAAELEARREKALEVSAPVDAPPVDVLTRLRLTGDFPRDAIRVRDEAALLRRQAEALDVIADGIEQLAGTAA